MSVDNKCGKCGLPLQLHVNGPIAARSGPLNWWECPRCGRDFEEGTITVTTLVTANDLRALADAANECSYAVDVGLFDELYYRVLEDAQKGFYNSDLIFKTKDQEALKLACARFSEMGCEISCLPRGEDYYSLSIKF